MRDTQAHSERILEERRLLANTAREPLLLDLVGHLQDMPTSLDLG
jgi:hypothetical protein